MTQEMKTAVSRLQTLPESAQSELAPRLNAYLNKLEDLRADVQEGLTSGPTLAGADVFDRLEAKYEKQGEA